MQYSFTSDNASAMARRRWEKFREAAADAVTKELGSIAPNAVTPEAAWGVLNARLALQIMDSDKPRGKDMDSLGRNMGAIPNAYERSEQENSGGPDAGAIAALNHGTAQILAGVWSDVMQLHEGANTIDGTLLPNSDISGSNDLRIGEQDTAQIAASPTPPPAADKQET